MINKTALEWFEAKTGPPDVSDSFTSSMKKKHFFAASE